MVKRYNHNYTIYKKYELGEIREHLKENELPEKLVYHEKDYKDSLRRMNILNDLIERDGNKCLHCKKEATLFAMGKDVANRWHMDLYREEPEGLLMFTIDHVFPKSKGGEDKLENFQMLCKVCNEDKGDDLVNEPKPKSKKKRKYKPKYIPNKLDSLSQQVTGILSKLKSHKIVNIKQHIGFTIGKEYNILNIEMVVDNSNNTTFYSKYKILLVDDNEKLIWTEFPFFVTTNDYYLMNK